MKTLPDGLKPTSNPNLAIVEENHLYKYSDLSNIHLPKDLDKVEIKLRTVNDVKRALDANQEVVERHLVTKEGFDFTAYYLIIKFEDILKAGK